MCCSEGGHAHALCRCNAGKAIWELASLQAEAKERKERKTREAVGLWGWSCFGRSMKKRRLVGVGPAKHGPAVVGFVHVAAAVDKN